MSFTRHQPADVLPYLDPLAEVLPRALRTGIAWADELQVPDVDDDGDLDRHFRSHCARYKAKRILAAEADPAEGWEVVDGVPNTGIHLLLGDMLVARVLRASQGTTPAPGRNHARRRAWGQRQSWVQGQFDLDVDSGAPTTTVIVDWYASADGEPILHLGLPAGIWDYKSNPILAWRVPLFDDPLDMASLRFDPGPDNDDLGILLQVDDEELGAG